MKYFITEVSMFNNVGPRISQFVDSTLQAIKTKSQVGLDFLGAGKDKLIQKIQNVFNSIIRDKAENIVYGKAEAIGFKAENIVYGKTEVFIPDAKSVLEGSNFFDEDYDTAFNKLTDSDAKIGDCRIYRDSDNNSLQMMFRTEKRVEGQDKPSLYLVYQEMEITSEDKFSITSEGEFSKEGSSVKSPDLDQFIGLVRNHLKTIAKEKNFPFHFDNLPSSE
jgi:hypothetical protein